MVKLNRIYTKTGDDGTTGLGTGERVLKYNTRIEAMGAVDEANCAIGIARNHTSNIKEIDDALALIQNDLFDLGADLCTPETEPAPEWQVLRIVEAQVKRLEDEIDKWNASLKPLNSFILPGGSLASSYLHLARSIVRRAEREMVKLSNERQEKISKPALHYINRLSDLLFVLARITNKNGIEDVLWKPGMTINGDKSKSDNGN